MNSSQLKSKLAPINSQLKQKPLVYVCVELERALGIESLVDNYHIICYDDSKLIDYLQSDGINVHSAVRAGAHNQIRRSSAALLSSDFAQNLINDITAGGEFYLQTFSPTKPFQYHAQQMRCELVNNPVDVSNKFENNLSLAEFTTDIPNPFVGTCQLSELDHYPLPIIVKTAKSHTGQGTYRVNDATDAKELIAQIGDQPVQVSRILSGDTWTVNGAIYQDQCLVSGLSMQITGLPWLTTLANSTVGNDWSASSKLSQSDLNAITTITHQVGDMLSTHNYRGLFGIDIMYDGEWQLIEINARQTANIPMQSHLEISNNLLPLSCYHLAEFMDAQLETTTYKLGQLTGSQVFIRAPKQLNHSRDIPAGVVSLDQPVKRSLIRPEYNVSRIEPGEILLLSSNQTEYEHNAEIARLQSRDTIDYLSATTNPIKYLSSLIS